MILLLRRVRRRLTGQGSWLLPAVVAAFVFVSGWVLMALVEPAIAAPRDYWWWWLITSTTVGYGDLFPTTTAGRLVGLWVVVGGITTITLVFGRVMAVIENAKGRRMQGTAGFSGSGHVVVLGYTAGRTERMVEMLLADGDRDVVLCAWEDQVPEHPMPQAHRTHFVRGDLADEDVLGRAGLDRASAVLVDARDDNEAVTLTIAAEHVAPEVHTVVTLRDLTAQRSIARVHATAPCVQWHSLRMVVEELQDAGIALVYQELTTPGGANTYSTAVPATADGTAYGTWQQSLGRAYGATLLAFRGEDGMQVSPEWDTAVPGGAMLYYVAPERLPEDALLSALARA